MKRREFLQMAVLGSFSFLLPGIPAWAYRNSLADASSKKLIVVFLRGGVDGLNVVVPYGDASYYAIRPTIALPKPGTASGAIDLDGYFGLHPVLAPLMPLWRNKSLAFVHASGSPDPSRSHFDAQDYMESGVPGEKFISTGWLNRLVSLLPSKNSPVQAVSLGPVLPRIFAGPAPVATVPKAGKMNRMPIDHPLVAEAFQELYAGRNDYLEKAFTEGMAAHRTINKALFNSGERMDAEQLTANRGAPLPGNFKGFGSQLASLFVRDTSVQVAFMDLGGWDTHINQGSNSGQLANHLTVLGNGLADLIRGLGPLYRDTTIVVMSEFGRTAHENGNGGTDHGHGNVMWILGGQIPGGKVYGRWAGLAKKDLHEERDLPTTTDFRNVLSWSLNNLMHVPKTALEKVFPSFQASESPLT
jgi:uncharacterized protein (DUF1501 family)